MYVGKCTHIGFKWVCMWIYVYTLCVSRYISVYVRESCVSGVNAQTLRLSRYVCGYMCIRCVRVAIARK